MSLNDQALAAHMEHLDEEPRGIECYHAFCCESIAEYVLRIPDNNKHNFIIKYYYCRDCAIEALKDMKPNQEIVKL